MAKAEARDFKLRGQAAIESHAALQAGSGFMLQGSPALVQDVLFGEVELGAARLEHAGEVEAFRLGNEAELLFHNALNDKVSASMSREMGTINAGFIKEAGKIRLEAAFLNGDRSLLTQQAALLGARTAVTAGAYNKIASKTAQQARRVEVAAAGAAASSAGKAAIVGGFGSAFNTIASSGMFK